MIASPYSSVSTLVDGDTISVSTIAHIGLQPNPSAVQQTVLIQVRVSTVTSRLVTVPASGWQGTGPYHQDIDLDGMTLTEEYMVYVDHTATVMQRAAEYNAVLKPASVGSGSFTLRALSVKPTEDLPIRVASGQLPIRTLGVPASAWTGSGPWTATLTLPVSMSTAVAGPVDGASDTQTRAFFDSGIHVSALSGTSITLRAIIAKPTMDLVVGIAGA